MGLKLFKTWRNARQSERGDAIGLVTLGGHCPGLRYFPATLGGALDAWDWYVLNGSYTAADFTAGAENSGTTVMSANGLLATTGAADGNANRNQLIRSKAPAADKVQIFHMRFSMGDVTNTGLALGAYNTTSDWFSAEGTHSMAFLKAKAAATVVGRSKDGTNGSSTSTLITLSNDTLYDATVIYDGFEATPTLWYGIKPAATPWATSHWATKTTNRPASALRLSFELENGEGSSNTLLIDRMAWAAMK